MSSSRVQFDIKSKVCYVEYLDNRILRVHMEFLDDETAIKDLEKLKLEIQLILLNYSIDLTNSNPEITSDTIPSPHPTDNNQKD